VQTHARVASSIGALELPPELVVPIEEVEDHPREQLLVVISGTQGEQRSALGRLAADGHRQLHVERGDLVVLSSRFIPGNEIAISRMIDRLLKLGARVMHHGNHDHVHVSGHGSRAEILKAIEAVRPRAFLPAHGTYRHMAAAAELARGAGVASVAVAADGQPVRYADGELRHEPEPVPVGRVFIDGGSGLSEQVIRDRRLLGMHGLLFVSWHADDDGRITRDLQVLGRGVTGEEAQSWLAGQVEQEVRRVVGSADTELRRDGLRCRELVRSAVRRFVSKTIKREPFVVVSIIPES
jgi:ribonuclease J